MNFSNIASYKGLIFDFDGTLIDSMPAHIRAWQMTANERGFEIRKEDVKKRAGSSSYDIALYYKQQGMNVGDVDSFVERKIAFYNASVPTIKVFPKVFSLLKDAHAKGVKIAVGTGSRTVNVQKVLSCIDLEPYIDVIVSADDVQHHKPHPETFWVAAKKMGLKPESCLVFDDAIFGILAAINGGFDCIEVDNDTQKNYFQIER